MVRRKVPSLHILGLTALVLTLSPLAPATARPADESVIDITLSSFKYAPDTIHLDHGRSYILHFVNSSSGGHDFTAKPFFDAAVVVPGDRAKISGGSIKLDGGKEARIHLTAPAPGRFKVHCSHFMHSTFGMTGDIIVD
jgi:uncharacterized cupredoxin-like copper-binding protein